MQNFSSDEIHKAFADVKYTLEKISYIKKLPDGWAVMSLKGKQLGKYKTKELARKRLRQIEFWKHKKASEELKYSNVMRSLHKKNEKDIALKFQQEFKQYFDEALINDMENPEEYAMEKVKPLLDKIASLNIAFNKIGSAIELGDPLYAGKYLSDLVKFLLRRISNERRQKAINTMKRKIYYLNEYDIASKKTPSSASMGQALTLLKTILLDHNPEYIRKVLNSIVGYL